jgi:general stress protein YciG
MAKKKNAAAVQLGRLGGQKKVPKGFSTMDPERRAEVGKKAAQKRWGKKKTAKI